MPAAPLVSTAFLQPLAVIGILWGLLCVTGIVLNVRASLRPDTNRLAGIAASLVFFAFICAALRLAFHA